MRVEFKGRCPICKTVRTVFGFEIKNLTPEEMDRAEEKIDERGYTDFHCPTCDAIEEVAMFWDGKQEKPWVNAIEFERTHGPAAGPLPPKPWRTDES